jgi:hypothetical protein
LSVGSSRRRYSTRSRSCSSVTVRTVIPKESKLKDALSGTWLGRALHPPLTDLVIGGWTSALLLDLLGGDGAEDTADRLVAVGILAAVPTALSGLSDWAELYGGSRRLGSVHAIGNSAALTLREGRRRQPDRLRGSADRVDHGRHGGRREGRHPHFRFS